MKAKSNNLLLETETDTGKETFGNIYTIATSLNRQLLYLGGNSMRKDCNVNILVLNTKKMKIQSKKHAEVVEPDLIQASIPTCNQNFIKCLQRFPLNNKHFLCSLGDQFVLEFFEVKMASKPYRPERPGTSRLTRRDHSPVQNPTQCSRNYVHFQDQKPFYFSGLGRVSQPVTRRDNYVGDRIKRSNLSAFLDSNPDLGSFQLREDRISQTRFWGFFAESFDVLNDLETVLGTRYHEQNWQIVSEHLKESKTVEFDFAHTFPVIMIRKHEKTGNLFSGDQNGRLVVHGLGTASPKRVIKDLKMGDIYSCKIIGHLLFLGGSGKLRIFELNQMKQLECEFLRKNDIGIGSINSVALAKSRAQGAVLAMGSDSSSQVVSISIVSLLERLGVDAYHVLKSECESVTGQDSNCTRRKREKPDWPKWKN